MNKCLIFAIALFAVGVNAANLPAPDDDNKVSSDSKDGGVGKMERLMEEVVERTSFAIGMKLITVADEALGVGNDKKEYVRRGKRDLLSDLRRLLKKNYNWYSTYAPNPSSGYWQATTYGPYPSGVYGSGSGSSSGYGPYPTGGYGSGSGSSSGYGPYPTGGYGSGSGSSSGYGPYSTGGYGSGSGSGYGPYPTGGYGSGSGSGYGPYPTGGYGSGSGSSSGYGPYPTSGYGSGSGHLTATPYGPYPTGGYGSGSGSSSGYWPYSYTMYPYRRKYGKSAKSKRRLDDETTEAFRIVKMIGEILVGPRSSEIPDKK